VTIEIAAALAKLYPAKFVVDKMVELMGNAATIKRLAQRDRPVDIVSSWNGEIGTFRKMRAKYLLYRW